MLDIDLVTILAEIFNSLVLAVALYYLLFKPIVKRMEKNAQMKAALMTEAQEKEEQASQTLAEIEDRLENIDTEIEARLHEAYRRAQSESDALLEITRQEAEKILNEAELEAAKQQQREINELQEDLIETILTISGQVLINITPPIIHENLVSEAIEEIWDLGKRDMHQVTTIRDTLAERTPTVLVRSAKELTPDQQRSLVRTFSALADRNVNMEIDIDPELISGIYVRMGDLVVANNLKVELDQLKNEIADSLVENISNGD